MERRSHEKRRRRWRRNGKQFLIRGRIGEQWSSSALTAENNWLIEQEEQEQWKEHVAKEHGNGITFAFDKDNSVRRKIVVQEDSILQNLFQQCSAVSHVRVCQTRNL